jgi:hypothetical protein
MFGHLNENYVHDFKLIISWGSAQTCATIPFFFEKMWCLFFYFETYSVDDIHFMLLRLYLVPFSGIRKKENDCTFFTETLHGKKKKSYPALITMISLIGSICLL